MIPADLRRAIAQQLRDHLEVQLAAGFRRVGSYHLVRSGEFTRSVEEAVAGCLPAYIAAVEREATSVGVAPGDFRFSLNLPTVDVERSDPSAKGMTSREIRELVAATVKAATARLALTEVSLHDPATGVVTKRVRITRRAG